jgi:site-specific DNA recombinase
MNHPSKKAAATLPLVRCAIYTRKSTEEGLEQEFNSLDAQRESAEAFIRSQAHEGWTCLLERYDDGGFTGGNMERPALKRLLTDIDAGKIDLVVCYKVDRLSRSLLDFAKMMETFEQHGVSFVSVTQQFNTATSMGRLVLNVAPRPDGQPRPLETDVQKARDRRAQGSDRQAQDDPHHDYQVRVG